MNKRFTRLGRLAARSELTVSGKKYLREKAMPRWGPRTHLGETPFVNALQGLFFNISRKQYGIFGIATAKRYEQYLLCYYVPRVEMMVVTALAEANPEFRLAVTRYEAGLSLWRREFLERYGVPHDSGRWGKKYSEMTYSSPVIDYTEEEDEGEGEWLY